MDLDYLTGFGMGLANVRLTGARVVPVGDDLEVEPGHQGIVASRGGTVELVNYHLELLLGNCYKTKFIVINRCFQ